MHFAVIAFSLVENFWSLKNSFKSTWDLSFQLANFDFGWDWDSIHVGWVAVTAVIGSISPSFAIVWVDLLDVSFIFEYCSDFDQMMSSYYASVLNLNWPTMSLQVSDPT